MNRPVIWTCGLATLAALWTGAPIQTDLDGPIALISNVLVEFVPAPAAKAPAKKPATKAPAKKAPAKK